MKLLAVLRNKSEPILLSGLELSITGPVAVDHRAGASRPPSASRAVTTADPGPEQLPPRPTLNSTVTPAPYPLRAAVIVVSQPPSDRRAPSQIPPSSSVVQASGPVQEVPRSIPALLRAARAPWLLDGGPGRPGIMHPI